MNKIKLLLSLTSVILFISCNRTDFSNPENVVKNFNALSSENKNEVLYDDFLSVKSKEFVTKDEFIKNINIPDSTLNSTKYLESNISSYPVDINNPSYRRFKVEGKTIVNEDTLYSKEYYTLSNENGKWKVIWTNTLQAFAKDKYNRANYLEARETLEKIIDINPFCGEAYKNLAWAHLKDRSLSKKEWENGIVKNAKYALTLEDDNDSHYNTLAAYYSSIGNSDLAIENWERGLNYSQNKKDKVIKYSNMAGEYMIIKKYILAEEYLNKALESFGENKEDSNDKMMTFILFKYGSLMLFQNKYKEAIPHFEKALEKDNMELSLQSSLYFYYALSCLHTNNCTIAKEYINKALDIDPINKGFQTLYKQIKNCKEKT